MGIYIPRLRAYHLGLILDPDFELCRPGDGSFAVVIYKPAENSVMPFRGMTQKNLLELQDDRSPLLRIDPYMVSRILVDSDVVWINPHNNPFGIFLEDWIRGSRAYTGRGALVCDFHPEKKGAFEVAQFLLNAPGLDFKMEVPESIRF